MFGFGKLAGFFLDVKVEVSEAELALIKKHGWGDGVVMNGPRGDVQQVAKVVSNRDLNFFFDDIVSLEAAEEELVENLRALKALLEKDWDLEGGPREVEL
jgi:hypothetical protein